MRKIYLLGTALVAVFAFNAVAASGAFALESVFLVNGVKVAKETSIDSELVAGTELLMEDMKVPILGAVDLSCTAMDEEGTVGDENNAKFGLITDTEFLTCASLTSGATLVSIAAVNLPWLTELLLVEGKFLDDILASPGRPGYKIVVKTLLGNETDECGSSTKSADIDNTAENDIVVLFLEIETSECSIGGVAAGLNTGEVLTLTLSGEPIAVSEG
jgi:hypothetical protein